MFSYSLNSDFINGNGTSRIVERKQDAIPQDNKNSVITTVIVIKTVFLISFRVFMISRVYNFLGLFICQSDDTLAVVA